MLKYILLTTIAIWLVLPTHCQQWYETGNPHFLDVNTVFQAVKQQNTIKVIKFFSPWCKYCRFIKAYVDTYKSEHEISSNFKFYQFNCHSNGAMFCFQHFNVRAYPAVLMIDQKGEISSRIDGLYPQDVINNILEQFNNKAKALIGNNKQQNEQKLAPSQSKQTVQQTQTSTAGQNSQKQVKEQKKQEQIKEEDKKAENTKQQVKQDKKQQQQKKPAQQKQRQPQNKQQPKEQQKSNENTPLENKKSQSQAVESQKPKTEKAADKIQPEKQQKQSKTEVTDPIKIDKKIVQQPTSDQILKANPANPDNEKQLYPQMETKPESGSFIKYILYLIGIGLGVMYAVQIFIRDKKNKQKQSKQSSSLPQANRTQQQPPKTMGTSRPASNNSKTSGNNVKFTARDIQNQILVEEIADQHL